ncbi:EamA family transporter [Kaistia dalseonensis]|uniref:Drug/metabolite transporter (DMT)-like permease n=1 Tax=Kaistia dalseonensis TaxID=410840 RepID=A0ABU0H7I6_9HYPH|nr:EamA family transporter [Kaistia dalseonensis]MCX5495680.1 EamA family transporter [Kaistia dalseonensis]MDQ0438276.1 drug/metabolite transporter (DMT)-like permease [Kaistia dalseonensis]
MTNTTGYIYLAANLFFSLLGTLAMKWRATSHSATATEHGRLAYLVSMLLDPWVILSLASAALAMIAWIYALERVELSRAFAFTALIYVLIPLFSWLFLKEHVSIQQIVGALLIIGGVVLAELGRH